ncbi:MAG: DJ-1 family glyoxalase III [Candidatus Cryptobacteroides sp.]
MKGIHIFLADGFEESEALVTLDILRRAGLEACTVTLPAEEVPQPFVTGSHGVTVVADMIWEDFADEAERGASPEDVMIFPGGMPGTKHLAACEDLIEMMNEHYAEGGTVAAICAAPGLVLSQLEGIAGKRFTAFDGFEGHTVEKGGIYVKAPAVRDGNVITGRGAGCAIDFGLAIVEHVLGPEAAAKVRHGLMI